MAEAIPQIQRLTFKEKEALEAKSSFPVKPQAGTLGKGVQIKANYYNVSNLPVGDIIQYDINISPTVPLNKNREIFQLMEQTYKQAFGNIVLAYDGRSSMYSPTKLPEEHYTLDVRPEYRREPFKVTIKFVAAINMETLRQFLEGNLKFTPYEAIQALEIVIRHVPSKLFAGLGRSFYSGKGANPLPGPVEVWHGYFQTLKATRGRLLLNVDVAATTYYKSGNLIELAKKYSDGRSMNETDRKKFERVVRGLRVRVNHRSSGKRDYRIMAISTMDSENTSFECEGTMVSVCEYFFRKFQIRLKHPKMPCIRAGTPEKALHLPLECCDILTAQRYPKKLDEEQTAAMIKITCVSPQERFEKLSKGLDELNIRSNPVMDAFQISIGGDLLTVNARILDPPTIFYGQNSREKTIQPRDGSWNLINKCVDTGALVKSWAVLSFGKIPENVIETFIVELVSTCEATGMRFEGPAREPPIVIATTNVEQSVINAFKTANQECKSAPQFIICILPNTGAYLYGEIKRVTDTVIGLPSQCMQSKHIFQPKKQYCANLCLKINVKLGGVNATLGTQLKFIGDKPTIVFGADVTHPGAGESSKPSIAALVASLDIKMSQYASLVRTQDARQEVISEMQPMTKTHLLSFYQATKLKPMRILYYRDGVGEGQFAQVVEYEVEAIKKACAELDVSYKPSITMIIVQKRHHTRFYPIDRNAQDRSGNVLPGTVVDTVITHPTQYDFFLCSHGGLKGTSRPVHYNVIYDDNKFPADEIQALSYRLCYTFARCTRSVSIVPPVYYAHLAAFRSKFHFKISDDVSESSGSSGLGVFVPVKAGLDRTMYFI